MVVDLSDLYTAIWSGRGMGGLNPMPNEIMITTATLAKMTVPVTARPTRDCPMVPILASERLRPEEAVVCCVVIRMTLSCDMIIVEKQLNRLCFPSLMYADVDRFDSVLLLFESLGVKKLVCGVCVWHQPIPSHICCQRVFICSRFVVGVMMGSRIETDDTGGLIEIFRKRKVCTKDMMSGCEKK